MILEINSNNPPSDRTPQTSKPLPPIPVPTHKTDNIERTILPGEHKGETPPVISISHPSPSNALTFQHHKENIQKAIEAIIAFTKSKSKAIKQGLRAKILNESKELSDVKQEISRLKKDLHQLELAPPSKETALSIQEIKNRLSLFQEYKVLLKSPTHQHSSLIQDAIQNIKGKLNELEIYSLELKITDVYEKETQKIHEDLTNDKIYHDVLGEFNSLSELMRKPDIPKDLRDLMETELESLNLQEKKLSELIKGSITSNDKDRITSELKELSKQLIDARDLYCKKELDINKNRIRLVEDKINVLLEKEKKEIPFHARAQLNTEIELLKHLKTIFYLLQQPSLSSKERLLCQDHIKSIQTQLAELKNKPSIREKMDEMFDEMESYELKGNSTIVIDKNDFNQALQNYSPEDLDRFEAVSFEQAEQFFDSFGTLNNVEFYDFTSNPLQAQKETIKTHEVKESIQDEGSLDSLPITSNYLRNMLIKDEDSEDSFEVYLTAQEKHLESDPLHDASFNVANLLEEAKNKSMLIMELAQKESSRLESLKLTVEDMGIFKEELVAIKDQILLYQPLQTISSNNKETQKNDLMEILERLKPIEDQNLATTKAKIKTTLLEIINSQHSINKIKQDINSALNLSQDKRANLTSQVQAASSSLKSLQFTIKDAAIFKDELTAIDKQILLCQKLEELFSNDQPIKENILIGLLENLKPLEDSVLKAKWKKINKTAEEIIDSQNHTNKIKEELNSSIQLINRILNLTNRTDMI